MKRRILMLAAALMLLATPASAQQTLTEGARIRIRQKDQPRLIGTLYSLSSDSISWLDSAGVSHVLARQNLELERSLGIQHRFWKHFGLTMLTGAVLGGFVSAASWSECHSGEFLGCLLVPESRSEAAMWGVLAGAAVGIPLGAIMGAVIKVERWEPVPR